MKEPCVIMTREQSERGIFMGFEILPEIIIIPFFTEAQAKSEAKEWNGTFARIDYSAAIGL
jgi:hypothetical protein